MNREDGDLGARDRNFDIRLQTSNELDLNVEHDSHSPKVAKGKVTPSGLLSRGDASSVDVLNIGTEFESDEHAYRFYNEYARILGFSVRKDWVNRSKIHGQVVSRKFNCSREGYRRKDKRDINVKKHRKETRTGCLAHMIVTRQPDGKYRVTQFEAYHNHDNIKPNNAQISQLQKELCNAQAANTNSTNNTMSPSDLELMDSKFDIRDSLDYLVVEYGNYLRSERTRCIKEGEAGRLLHHFQRQHFENPSFFYTTQLDIDDKVSNIFWSDDNMVLDYNHFGDVLCLDTEFRMNKEFQPFVQFIGVNHHNQVVLFAAAFLFDDTPESLKWLLHTFLQTMSQKKLKVILTDQDAAIIEAVNSVLPETDHRVCIWQMYQNALRHLSHVVKNSESFTTDFRNCIFGQKDEDDFTAAWGALLDNYGLQRNEWLRWMFREKEKWASVYGRNTFFLDITNSHLIEGLSNNLKGYLISDHDILYFFKHFEKVVAEQRFKEAKANDEMHTCNLRLMANVILLRRVSEVYTPNAFELFQWEYEKCLNIIVCQSSQNRLFTEYKVKTFGKSREYRVTFNSLDETVVCSCMKFEYVGFLCCHVLKVLDHRNIKVLPSQYILKRWSKDARIRNVRESSSEFIEDENPKVVAARRYKDLCGKILNISARAVDSEEAFQFASRQLDEVLEGVEKILKSTEEDASESENADIFLDENIIEEQDEENIVQAVTEKGTSIHSQKPNNMNGRSSKSERIHDAPGQSPNTQVCISSSSTGFASPEAPSPIPVMQQSLYNFEPNQVVQCMYQQPNLLIDQQSNTDMYEQPNFYTDQDDQSGQTQLLQEPCTYQDSISNTAHLRQAIDLDVQHSRSSSFFLYDHRYRASESPYIVPK